MHLTYKDGREIAELCDLQTRGPIGNAPIEYTAKISTDGVRILQKERASFYRGREGALRFTLTIDDVSESLTGTIRQL
jgi:hypothetical protein